MKIILFVMFIFFAQYIFAQDSIGFQKSKIKKVNVSRTANDLKIALVENNEIEIAKNYEKLAADFDLKGNKPKAEEYLKKAQAIYARRKEMQSLKTVSRSLAKNQEAQKDFSSATVNYRVAGKNAASEMEQRMNSNDAMRIENAGRPAIQEKLIDDNIKLADKVSEKEEVADGYLQKAAIQVNSSNTEGAIKSYNNAILNSNKAEDVVEIQSKLAKVYANKGDFDKAIAINKNLIEASEKSKDYSNQILQLQSLATIYVKKKEPQNAIEILKKSYQIASQSGNTAEVKSSLQALLNFYKTAKNDKEQIALYDDFLKKIDNIIDKDSSLIDSKNFQIIEEKIQQLEKEKSLTDELISKKNKFNYFLIIAILSLLFFLALIAKALFSIKRKNKKIALQSLRQEMNPHFIFNSLNSVNQFISENKELEANKYLTSYSNLMRDTMENSNKDFISLSNEINQLQKYLDLEHLRFQDQFDFKILIDDAIDTETIFVPNMIIQPHLENAIWHGLRYTNSKGFLLLDFKIVSNKLQIIIDDNGIGITKSMELKTQNQKVHQSVGTQNTKNRIALLNDLYHKNIAIEICEKDEISTGTIVKISMPIISKIS